MRKDDFLKHWAQIEPNQKGVLNMITVSTITLERGDSGTYLVVNDQTGESILIQADWDYPGVASSFGFVPCGQCNDTDGTVDCAHKTAEDMIYEASEFLDDNIGESAVDPGYFS